MDNEWHSILKKLDGLISDPLGVRLNDNIDALFVFVIYYFNITQLADKWKISRNNDAERSISLISEGKSHDFDADIYAGYDKIVKMHYGGSNDYSPMHMESGAVLKFRQHKSSIKFNMGHELLTLLRRYYPSDKDDEFFRQDPYFTRVFREDIDAAAEEHAAKERLKLEQKREAAEKRRHEKEVETECNKVLVSSGIGDLLRKLDEQIRAEAIVIAYTVHERIPAVEQQLRSAVRKLQNELQSAR